MGLDIVRIDSVSIDPMIVQWSRHLTIGETKAKLGSMTSGFVSLIQQVLPLQKVSFKPERSI